jgi:hypothetical protein
MENDDKPIGRILSRRDALRVLGSAALPWQRVPAEATATLANGGSHASRFDAGIVHASTVPDCVSQPESRSVPIL